LRRYLWGHPFLIKTDHYNLKFLLGQWLSIIPQHQWARKLLGFDFHAEFKIGATNVVADALSHLATEEAVAMTLSYPSFQLFDTLHRELEATPDLRAFRDKAAARTRGTGWQVHDDLILITGRVYLTPTSACL
jgi:hypothetical protein